MDGLLLFSHGSLLCGAGHALDQHADRLRERDEFPLVQVGYLNYSEPTFETGVRRLTDAGADRIVIVPYFLVPGYFVTNSLPNELNRIKGTYPNVEFVIADPLGTDDLIADALIEFANDAVPICPGDRSHYIQSASDCRNRPDCPLYGGPYCATSANVISTEVEKSQSLIPNEAEARSSIPLISKEG